MLTGSAMDGMPQERSRMIFLIARLSFYSPWDGREGDVARPRGNIESPHKQCREPVTRRLGAGSARELDSGSKVVR